MRQRLRLLLPWQSLSTGDSSPGPQLQAIDYFVNKVEQRAERKRSKSACVSLTGARVFSAAKRLTAKGLPSQGSPGSDSLVKLAARPARERVERGAPSDRSPED
jgi:hypothetical protein